MPMSISNKFPHPTHNVNVKVNVTFDVTSTSTPSPIFTVLPILLLLALTGCSTTPSPSPSPRPPQAVQSSSAKRLITPETIAAAYPDYAYIPITADAQQSLADCGPAVLAAVLNHWFPDAPPHSPASISRLHPPASTMSGYSLNELKRIAKTHKARVKVIDTSKAGQLPLDFLLSQIGKGRPIIVPLKVAGPPVHQPDAAAFLHYHLLIGYSPDKEKLLLADPAKGLTTLSRADFYARWKPSGYTALIATK